jgi:pSer/pThr/pTyr-binding forkhead associated (FHA) protein/tetratricopeptide (TPR) repeat protein
MQSWARGKVLMTKLILRRKGEVLSEIILDSSKSWIAGRKPDADILLDGEKGISREHFKIFEENGIWRIEVLSKLSNMTSNGEALTSAVLSPGYTFSLPPFDFELVIDESPVEIQPSAAVPIEPISLDDRTVVHQTILSAYIKILTTDGDIQQKIKLEGGDTWTAGRDVNAQILISDHKVSRKQFEIRKSNSGYEIVDLGSVNGTFINEKLLEANDVVILKSGDVIRVLDHTLVFEILDPHFFEKIENLPSIVDPISSDEVALGYLPADAQPQQPFGENSSTSEDFDYSVVEDPAVARAKKFRMGLIGLIVIGGLIYFISQPSKDDSLSNVAPLGIDPLAALTSQQKSEYKQSLELAKRYHMEGNYNLALSEADELVKKYNVKDPALERVRNTAQAAIESQKLLIKQEKEAKDRQAMENRIQAVATLCAKSLNRYNREEELDNCLVEALQLDPAHPVILDIKAKLQALLMEKNARKLQKAEYNRKVAQLKALYRNAQKTESEEEYIKTIAAYKKVISSSLPDPGDLKGDSVKRLDQLKTIMDKKIAQYEAQATDHKAKQEYKQAILVLREAIKIDPTRQDLKDRADDLKNELRKQMMVYYQEGVLEESFGNVDGGDNRAGAKEKWKKILNLDVIDGEYYQKAFIKLKKYGAT